LQAKSITIPSPLQSAHGAVTFGIRCSPLHMGQTVRSVKTKSAMLPREVVEARFMQSWMEIAFFL
jgi:hypothetical protein